MVKPEDSSDRLRPTRRSVITGTSITLMAVNVLSLQRPMAGSRGGPQPPSPPAAGVAQYVATLNTGSAVYIFDSADAVDQGNYVGAFVQQKSLMVTLRGCPFTVFFRPDVNGLRDEVVVELGKMWSGIPA